LTCPTYRKVTGHVLILNASLCAGGMLSLPKQAYKMVLVRVRLTEIRLTFKSGLICDIVEWPVTTISIFPLLT
jgi:hypothetical protein